MFQCVVGESIRYEAKKNLDCCISEGSQIHGVALWLHRVETRCRSGWLCSF